MFKGFGIEKVFESYIDPPKLNLNPNLRNIRNLRKHPPLPASLFANSIIEPLSPINTTLNFNFSYGKEQQPSNQNHPSSSYLSYLSIHTFPFPTKIPINEKTFVKSIYPIECILEHRLSNDSFASHLSPPMLVIFV